MDTKKYLINFLTETENGAINNQIIFDFYDKAIDFGHKLCKCTNIKSVSLETLLISYSETSVLKD